MLRPQTCANSGPWPSTAQRWLPTLARTAARQQQLASRSSRPLSLTPVIYKRFDPTRVSEPPSKSGAFTEFVVNDRWLDCDVDFKHGDQVAPMHRHIDFVRVDRDVFRDGVQNFPVENRDEIGIAGRLSFMRQKNLQSFTRYRRGCAAAKEPEEINAALRPKNLRKRLF